MRDFDDFEIALDDLIDEDIDSKLKPHENKSLDSEDKKKELPKKLKPVSIKDDKFLKLEQRLTNLESGITWHRWTEVILIGVILGYIIFDFLLKKG